MGACESGDTLPDRVAELMIGALWHDCTNFGAYENGVAFAGIQSGAVRISESMKYQLIAVLCG